MCESCEERVALERTEIGGRCYEVMFEMTLKDE